MLALLSLFKFSLLIAASIVIGAVLGLFNLYSVVRLVEALTGGALSGAVSGKSSKAITMVVHIINIAVIAAVLVVLVWNQLINLFAFLAGFTVVQIVNLFAGLTTFAEGADKAP